MVLSLPATSKISGFLIKTPWEALFPVATAMAAGVASPKAQGQLITKTDKAKFKLSSRFLETNIQIIKVSRAIPITEKTKYLEIVSANLSIGIFSLLAFLVRLIILDKTVVLSLLFTCTFIVPLVLIVPPITSSPTFFKTGKDSPVIIDSSREEEPFMIIPSLGTDSPGLITTISFFFKSLIDIVISSLSFNK